VPHPTSTDEPNIKSHLPSLHSTTNLRTTGHRRRIVRADTFDFKGCRGKWHTLGALEHIWAHLGPCFRAHADKAGARTLLTAASRLHLVYAIRRAVSAPARCGRVGSGLVLSAIKNNHSSQPPRRFNRSGPINFVADPEPQCLWAMRGRSWRANDIGHLASPAPAASSRPNVDEK